MASLNKFLNLIIILGCAVFAFFFYQYRTDKEQALSASQPVEQSSVKPNVDPLDLANKYLQEAQLSLSNDKLRASINIKKALAESEAAQKGQAPATAEVDPSKVAAEQQIWKDPSTKVPTTLDSSVQSYRGEQLVAPNGMDKQEYIRQFKDNARKNGYEITVNDDLEVTNVQPIRKPQNDYDSNRGSEESEQ